MMLRSGNDAAYLIAKNVFNSYDKFIMEMNNKAKELGMMDTAFRNCHGLDEDGHITSSYDIALMSRELLNNHPNITNYTTIYMDSLRNRRNFSCKYK